MKFSPSPICRSGLFAVELTLRGGRSGDDCEGREGVVDCTLVLDPDAWEFEVVMVGGNGFRSLAFFTSVARSGEDAVPGDRNRDLRLCTDLTC